MQTKWHFSGRNDELINHPLNVTFDVILKMSKDEFKQWCIDFRKLVVKLWDEKGLPPRMGYSKQDIIDNFNELIAFEPSQLLVEDSLTGEKNVIRNNTILGNPVNSWFPTMMKTRINYSNKDDGKSIYDFFFKDELLDTFITYATRHFKRDSFYHYSNPVKSNDIENHMHFPCVNDAVEWISKFESRFRAYGDYDYWIAPKDVSKEYNGYNEKLKERVNLVITEQNLSDLADLIPKDCVTNVADSKFTTYQIRVYLKGQKLFPVGLKAFRVSFCQYAVNFPPLTARYLYERYIQKLPPQDSYTIYDPSAGWSGRLLGAMAINDNYTVHYIGTDPNTDHTIKEGYTKYHDIAEFFNTETSRATNLFPKCHTYDIFQSGSETIHNDKNFRKFRGSVDIVFTSPPYFAKEAYSEDPEQSYKKFPTFDGWKDGFLRKTLETAVEWLRPGGYLLWNIADAKFGKDMLPLEASSNDILKELGMQYVETMKMALAQMPGGNRIDEKTGQPKAKNFCKVNGLWLKYEPVYVWQKPLT